MHKGIHNKKFVIFNSIMIVIVIGIIVIGSNYQKQSLETTTEQVANYENNRVIYMKEKNVIANEQLFVKEDESVEGTEEDELEDELEEETEVEEVETESIPLYTSKDTTETESSSAPTKPSKKPTTTNNTPTYETSKEEDTKDKDTEQDEDEDNQDEEKEPVVTTKTVTEELVIPFQAINQDDSELLVGRSQVIQEGINGIRTITYKETYTDGKLTVRKEISSKVTKKTIDQITAIGTKQPQDEPTEPIEEDTISE